MPVVFREDGFRFFFYSNEGDPREPAHIHVRKGDADAKFWLVPDVVVSDSFGLDRKALNDLTRIVEAHRDEIIEAWHDHFGNQR